MKRKKVRKHTSKPKKPTEIGTDSNEIFPIRLNRFIAKSGVCSRREADTLISDGKIKVNGNVVTEMGSKVNKQDHVTFGRKKLEFQDFIYLLLNKPKDFITTARDPQNRKTVMDLVKKAGNERIFPVGRLDRNTTGLLLLTNDGDLTKRLSHPSHKVSKVYHVVVDKPVTQSDINEIRSGIKLDDGVAEIDNIHIISPDKKEIGLEIHIGKNRVVRRIFEHLGYEIMKLDRVLYAGLTKKDISRGKWRFLTEKERIRLKHFK